MRAKRFSLWTVRRDDYGDGWWAETVEETGDRKWFRSRKSAERYAREAENAAWAEAAKK